MFHFLILLYHIFYRTMNVFGTQERGNIFQWSIVLFGKLNIFTSYVLRQPFLVNLFCCVLSKVTLYSWSIIYSLMPNSSLPATYVYSMGSQWSSGQSTEEKNSITLVRIPPELGHFFKQSSSGRRNPHAATQPCLRLRLHAIPSKHELPQGSLKKYCLHH